MPADRTAYTRVNWVNKQTKLNQGNFNQMDEGIKKNSDLAIECANYIDEIFVALIQQLAISYDHSTHVFSLSIGSATGNNATTRFNVNKSLEIHTVDVELNALINGLNQGTTVVARASADESGNNIKSNYGSTLDLTTSFNTTSGSFVLSLINKNGTALVSKTFTFEAATQAKAGLMTAQDKERLDILYALLASDDSDTVVNTIQEVLNIFNNYPEGVNLANALASKADKTNFEAHRDNTNNPHNVTKAQVGLGNADNTSDANKPVSTAQQAEFLKAKYHLGAFDTVDTSNADYDLITRQTGYLDLGSANWFYTEQYLLFWTIDIRDKIVKPSSSQENGDAVCSKYQNVPSVLVNTNNKSFAIETDGTIYIRDDDYNDSVAFKTAVQGVCLQYKTITSYTEKVIKGQPLNTLDQTGSEFVREEWEKTQQLWNEKWLSGVIDSHNGLPATDNNDICSDFIEVKPNTTYTYSVGNLYLAIKFYDSNKQVLQTDTWDVPDYGSKTFTTTSNTAFIRFRTVDYGNTYLNNIMLNEGDHAYPYQPYNGAIVHEKDIENVARTDQDNNFTTRQTISSTDDTGLSIKVPNSYTHANVMFLNESMQQLGNIGFNTSYKPEIYSMISHSFVDLVIATDLDPINDLLAELKTLVYDNQYPAVAEIDLTYATYYALPSQISGDKIIMSAGMDMTKVNGRSYVYNQWFDYDNFAPYSNYGITVSKNNGKVNFNGTATDVFMEEMVAIGKFKEGHKYYINGINGGEYATYSFFFNVSGTYFGGEEIFEFNSSINYGNLYFRVQTGYTINKDTDLKLVDLTQWFGSNDAIPADLLADPSLFTKKYWKKDLPYDTGHIEDSKPVKVIATGFNKFDEEWELGEIDPSTGGDITSDNWGRTKNFIRVIPNLTYYFKTSSQELYCIFYDTNKNLIKNVYFNTSGTFDIPTNCCYIRLTNYGWTTYNHDICINISDPLLNGKYLPYEKHEYPIIPIDMGTVDLGTLEWNYIGNNVFETVIGTAKDNTGLFNLPNIAFSTNIYKVVPTQYDSSWASETRDMIATLAYDRAILIIRNSNYSDATNFKNAVRGIILTYELATQSHHPLRSAGSVQDDNEKVKVGTHTFSGNDTFSAYGTDILGNARVMVIFANAGTLAINGKGISSKLLYKSNDEGYLGNFSPCLSTFDDGSGVFFYSTKTDNDEAIADAQSVLIGTELNYELATPTEQSPAIVLPENIFLQKGGSLEIEYDDGYSTPADIDFEVAVSKVLEE